ncbi:hypothetical protein D3C72_2005630 [compost metagenome]
MIGTLRRIMTSSPYRIDSAVKRIAKQTTTRKPIIIKSGDTSAVIYLIVTSTNEIKVISPAVYQSNIYPKSMALDTSPG